MKPAAAVVVPLNTRAERCRRRRANRKAGIRCYRATLREEDLEKVLKLARSFTESDLADRKRVEAELSEVLAIWCERWLRLRNAGRGFRPPRRRRPASSAPAPAPPAGAPPTTIVNSILDCLGLFGCVFKVPEPIFATHG
jgi:hypothetical protein